MSAKTLNSAQSCPMCKKHHRFRPFEAIKLQANTPRRLARLLQRVAPARLKKQPQPGKWSIAEILHHLADCEIVYGFRSRLILAEEKPRLTPFDQDIWAANLKYAQTDARLSLDTFTSLRRQNVAIMRRLAPADWDRRGDHAEYGPITYRQMVYHFVDHDQGHLAQIARLRGQLQEKKSMRA